MAKQLKIYKDKPLIMAGESMEEKQGMWYEKVSRELTQRRRKDKMYQVLAAILLVISAAGVFFGIRAFNSWMEDRKTDNEKPPVHKKVQKSGERPAFSLPEPGQQNYRATARKMHMRISGKDMMVRFRQPAPLKSK